MEANINIYYDTQWKAQVTTTHTNVRSTSTGTYFLKDPDYHKLITKVNRVLNRLSPRIDND